MKENEIKVDFEEQQLVLYAEKDDNSYGPIQTGSYISKNFLDDYQLKQQHLEESLLSKLVNDEMSPVNFFMILEDLTLSELAKRVCIRKSRVKKHLTSKYFKNAKVDELIRYADVFNIPLANLFQIIITKDDNKWKSHFVSIETSDNSSIEQHKTNNPIVVITKK